MIKDYLKFKEIIKEGFTPIFLFTFAASILESVGIIIFFPVAVGFLRGGEIEGGSFLSAFGLMDDEFLSTQALITILIGLILTKFAVVLLSKFYVAKTKAVFLQKMKNLLIGSFSLASLEYFRKLSIGDFVATIDSQGTRAMQAFYNFSQYVSHGIFCGVLTFVCFYNDFIYTVFMIIFGGLAFVSTGYLDSKLKACSAILSTTEVSLNSKLAELFNGFEYFKIIGKSSIAIRPAQDLVTDIAFYQKRMGVIHGILVAMKEPMVLLVVFATSGVMWSIFERSLEDYGATLILLYRASSSLHDMRINKQKYLENMGAVDRVFSELRGLKEDRMSQYQGNTMLTGDITPIDARNVDIVVGNDLILAGFNGVFDEGQVSVIFGKSGAGKSTLLKTLTGSYKCSGGTINWGGIGINELVESESRDKLGYIPQAPILLEGTILENLCWPDSPEMTDDLETLLAEFDLLEHFSSLENGVLSKIGEKGLRLSGGQIQRVAIVRELRRNPAVLLMDEPTSAIDSGATENFGLYVRKLARQGICVIIVTHDQSLIDIADQTFHLSRV